MCLLDTGEKGISVSFVELSELTIDSTVVKQVDLVAQSLATSLFTLSETHEVSLFFFSFSFLFFFVCLSLSHTHKHLFLSFFLFLSSLKRDQDSLLYWTPHIDDKGPSSFGVQFDWDGHKSKASSPLEWYNIYI